MTARIPAVVRSDPGFSSIQFIAGAGLALLVFVVAVNIVVVMYARGVMHAAADEGARAGSRASAGADICEQRGNEAIDEMLGGRLGDGVHIRCADAGGHVVAAATGTFRSWLVYGWEWTFEVESRAVRERVPA